MWAVCSNCGTIAGKLSPCVIWVPNDNLDGMTGCPYHIHGETNSEEMRPACWVAMPKADVIRYIEDMTCDDEPLDPLEEEARLRMRRLME